MNAAAGNRELPLVLEAETPAVLAVWLQDERDWVRGQVASTGAVLLRGFATSGLTDFEDAARTVSGELLEDEEQSSPRTAVAANVYTSTDYPASETIFLHNENSYAATWPLKLYFHCVEPAQEGGETPLADVRKVLGRIDPEVRRGFEARGWMAVRNFREGLGVPWQTVFGTDDRGEVDRYCTNHAIESEWRDDGSLRTKAIRAAVHRHPETGEEVWFNHLTFWHVTTLPPLVRDALLATFPEDELPTNTYYGDGGSIEPEVLDHLRSAYLAEEVAIPWRHGDLLIVDNMLAAHGRRPYTGTRKIVVAMAEPSG